MKSKVRGVGVLGGGISRVNGKLSPSYSLWQNMLRRCYSGEDKAYEGVTVCEEWLLFPAFEKWYRLFYRKGMCLDKDLLVPGNKVYGPATCVFIPASLNKALASKPGAIKKDSLPRGVYKTPKDRKGVVHYQAKVGNIYVGTYLDSATAHNAWRLARRDLFLSLAKSLHLSGEIDDTVYSAVLSYPLNW